MSAVDWDLIKREYCAGGLSLRDIAKAHNEANPSATISHVSISTHAEENGWERSLKGRIRARAETLIQRAEEIKPGLEEAEDTEVIEANAQRLVTIRSDHRKDIARLKALGRRVMAHLESLSDEEIAGSDRMLKSAVDTLKAYVALEREAYNINEAPETVEDNAPLDRTEIARKVAFMLTREAIEKAKV